MKIETRPRPGEERPAPRAHHRQPADAGDRRTSTSPTGRPTAWPSGSPRPRWSPSRCRAPATPTSPGCSSTAPTTCGPSSSAPAPARPPPAWPPGGVAKALLRRYGTRDPQPRRAHRPRGGRRCATTWRSADFEGVDESPVRCLDPEASARMKDGDQGGRPGPRHARRRLRGVGVRPAPGARVARERRRAPGRPPGPGDAWASRPSRASRSAPASSSGASPAARRTTRSSTTPRARLLPAHQPLRRHRGRHDPRRARWWCGR